MCLVCLEERLHNTGAIVCLRRSKVLFEVVFRFDLLVRRSDDVS